MWSKLCLAVFQTVLCLLAGAARADSLTLDTAATGTITGAGSQVVYSFDAAPGEVVWLKVSSTSGSVIPDLTVTDAAGTVIGSTANSGSTVELHLTASGTRPYTVAVHDLYYPTSSRTGAFVLYFTRIPGANELGRFFNGTTVSTTLDRGDLDTLTFTGQAGDTMRLDVSRTSGSFVPVITGYAPNGTQWFSVGSVASGQTVTSTLPQTGTYTVLVSAGTFSGAIGTYTVSLSGTGGTDPASGDVPLPGWARAVLAALLVTALLMAQRLTVRPPRAGGRAAA